MPEYLAPGVFVEETSFRAKTIEGVSTTTTGFIGSARFGPIHLEPDIITSLPAYEEIYDRFEPHGGELQFEGVSDVPNFLWHAVRAFFDEGGKRLYVCRVFKPLRGEYTPIGEADEMAPAGRQGRLYEDGHARVDPTLTAGICIRARHPGAAANLRVRLTLKGSANVLVADTDPVTGRQIATLRSVADLDVVWIREHGAPNGGFYIAHWNEEQAIWQFEPMVLTSPAMDDGLIDVGDLVVDPRPEVGDSVRVVTLQVSLLSRDGSREISTWSGLPLDPRHRSQGGLDSVFARFGTTPSSSADARLLPLVFARDPLLVADALDVLRVLFGADPTELLEPGEEEVRRRITPGDKLTMGVGAWYPMEGGNDGQRPDAAEFEGEADLNKGYSLGLKQFEDIEDISIVAAPGTTWQYASYRNNANKIIGLLISHAERMRYRVAILDSAQGQTIADVRSMRAKLDSKYAALYYPWVTVFDPVTRKELNLPPSGFVAGIYARNDGERAVYKAPANEVVRGAIGFETLLNKGQQEVLNPEGVNCFRFFEGRGLRLWGARTISSDYEWKYLNVRRYFAYVERSIDKGTQWVVFEPNGELLWANVRSTIGDFLLNEWQSGALLGEKPESAFFVRCDRSTMTQNDLDNGRLICLVGIAPLKPAEFVVFRIGQWTSDRKA
jgi:phage tail sheath protein FI